MKLLLFDIDGTLLHTRGVGRQAIEGALSDVLGRPVSSEGVSFSGKTDPVILRELFEQAGAPPEAMQNGLMPAAVEAYADALAETLTPDHVEVLPGVRALLDRLSGRPDVFLSILTGNVQRTAHLKLQAGGLDGFFRAGAFGSDHADRAELPAIAMTRASEASRHRFAGADVVIIGDTEHDIRCGRGVGARSVGVCTGSYAREDLAPHAPDLLLDDLSDPEALLRFLA